MIRRFISYLRRIHWAAWLGILFVVVSSGTVLLWGLSAAQQRAAYERLNAKCSLTMSGKERRHKRSSGWLHRWVEDKFDQQTFLDDHWWYTIDAASVSGRPERPGDANQFIAHRLHFLNTSSARRGTFTAADFDTLVMLQGLKQLSIDGFPMTAADLRKLRRLRRLEVLRLCETGLTDEGLDAVGMLTQLRLLSLQEDPLSGRGLRHLQSLSHLKILDLSKTVLDEEGLQSLPPLPSLQSLFLANSSVTDRDLSGVGRLTQLVTLSLRETKVNGVGLRHLHALPDLRNVELSGAPLNQEGLDTLTSLKQVTAWELFDTPLTSAEMKSGLLKLDGIHKVYTVLNHDDKDALRQARPNLRISVLEMRHATYYIGPWFEGSP